MGFFIIRNSEGVTLRSGSADNRKSSSSPEKEDRFYTTRGSVGLEENGNGKVSGDVNNNNNNNREDRGLVWPKLYITLSSKEKEEDFMAMKGCKLPQRPKKRAKIVQRSLLVSPSHQKQEKVLFFCDLVLFLRCLLFLFSEFGVWWL